MPARAARKEPEQKLLCAWFDLTVDGRNKVNSDVMGTRCDRPPKWAITSRPLAWMVLVQPRCCTTPSDCSAVRLFGCSAVRLFGCSAVRRAKIMHALSPHREASTSRVDVERTAVDLVTLQRLKQRLEVALAKALIALALDKLKEHRPKLGLREDLQQ